MSTPEFPDALADLRALFDSLGFDVVSEDSGGMGGYNLVLFGELRGRSGKVPAYVQFNSDRAFWTVCIKFGAMTRWTVAWVWVSYLDGVPLEFRGAEWDARFIADRLDNMVAAFESDPGIETDLRERGEGYMRRHYDME